MFSCWMRPHVLALQLSCYAFRKLTFLIKPTSEGLWWILTTFSGMNSSRMPFKVEKYLLIAESKFKSVENTIALFNNLEINLSTSKSFHLLTLMFCTLKHVLSVDSSTSRSHDLRRKHQNNQLLVHLSGYHMQQPSCSWVSSATQDLKSCMWRIFFKFCATLSAIHSRWKLKSPRTTTSSLYDKIRSISSSVNSQAYKGFKFLAYTHTSSKVLVFRGTLIIIAFIFGSPKKTYPPWLVFKDFTDSGLLDLGSNLVIIH